MRQLFFRMFFHGVGFRYRVLRAFCSTLLVWYSPFRVDYSSHVSGFSKSFLRWLHNEGHDPLLWLPSSSKNLAAGLFSPCKTLSFDFVYAPLLRFFSLQRFRYQEPVYPRFSLSGTVRSCAFSSLQRFALPVTSRVYFISKHSWDFPSELSPLRDWFLLPKRLLVFRRPLPLYRWLSHAPDA